MHLNHSLHRPLRSPATETGVSVTTMQDRCSMNPSNPSAIWGHLSQQERADGCSLESELRGPDLLAFDGTTPLQECGDMTV